MKVVGYAGSRSAFSKSICLGEKLKTMLREKNIVVEECRGCGKCFDEGLCPQDQEDSMEYIRKKILEADLIVLLSPVYLNNVSGAMKHFLTGLDLGFILWHFPGKWDCSDSDRSKRTGICFLLLAEAPFTDGV